MSLWNILLLVAFASSVVLLTQRCLYALAAVLASGIAALLAFDLVSFSSSESVPLMVSTISGVVGAVAYIRSQDKHETGSAAVLATVSGVQLVVLLELF